MFFKVPDNLSLREVAPLFCAGITMYKPLVKYAKKGDYVVVTGLGGLGHLGVKYAKALGCNVTVVTTSKDKIQLCKDLGADDVILCSSTDKEAEEEAFKKHARKFDVLLNTIHSIDQTTFDKYKDLLTIQGTWVQLGANPANFVNFQIGALCFSEHRFVGSQVGSKHHIQDMIEFSSKHNISPIVEEYEFDDFPKAWDKLINGRPNFRCVLKTLDGKWIWDLEKFILSSNP